MVTNGFHHVRTEEAFHEAVAGGSKNGAQEQSGREERDRCECVGKQAAKVARVILA